VPGGATTPAGEACGSSPVITSVLTTIDPLTLRPCACDCVPCAWDYRPFNRIPTSTRLGYSAPGPVGLSSACHPCHRIFVMGTYYTILFHLTFFLKTYILCRKIVVKSFLIVTLKVVPLHVRVSERAKLCCRPDPARESCLSSELSHLLSATFVHRYWHPCSHLTQPPAQLVYALRQSL